MSLKGELDGFMLTPCFSAGYVIAKRWRICKNESYSHMIWKKAQDMLQMPNGICEKETEAGKAFKIEISCTHTHTQFFCQQRQNHSGIHNEYHWAIGVWGEGVKGASEVWRMEENWMKNEVKRNNEFSLFYFREKNILSGINFHDDQKRRNNEMLTC